MKRVYNKYNNCVSLSDVIISTQYGYTASAKSEGSNRLLRITDINNGIVNWHKVPFCDCESPDKYELHAGDVLIARTGNNISYLVGKDVPEKAVFASYLIRIVCNTNLIIPEYLFMFLNSYVFWPQILSKQRGALLQNVNAKLMGQLEIPLCPISEQIKVTSGMYETETDRRNTRLLTLFRTYTEFKHNLGSQQELLNKLRQAFLREAMQGKLVPQDPNDEPASELLKRIKAEKARLIKEKKLKPGKELPPIKPEEIPFPIPENWVWCRFTDVVEIKSNLVSPYKYPSHPHISPEKIEKNTGRLLPYNTVLHDNVNSANQYFYPGQLLYSKVRPKLNKVVSVDFEGLCSADMYPLEPVVDTNYMLFCMLSIYFIDEVDKYDNRVKMPKINQTQLSLIPVPLPQLSEQKRIAEKLGQLTKTCYELQSNLEKNQILNDRLLYSTIRDALTTAKYERCL